MGRSGGTSASELATLLAGVLMAFAFSLRETISPFDGGILPAGAAFVLHGQLPYRDFWLLYGPLGAYVVALPTLIFGPSIEVVRGLGLLSALSYAVFAWLLLRRTGVGVIAIPTVIAATAIPVLVVGPELSAWNLSQTLGMAAFCTLARGSRRRDLLMAGAILGLAMLSRLDVGAYALAAAVAVIPGIWLIAGCMMVVIPAVLTAVSLVPTGNLIEQLIWFPTLGQHSFREIPNPSVVYGGPTGLMWLAVVAIPRGAVLAGLVAFTRRALRDRVSLMLLAFAMLCQAQTLVRADFYHFALAAPPAILLGAVVLSRANRSPRAIEALAAAMMAVVILAGFVHAGIASGAAVKYDNQLGTVARTIRSLSCAGEPVFIANGRNRYTYSNPLILYYLADRRTGSLYSMFNPGVTNTDAVQRTMVGELEANKVRLLVLDQSASSLFEVYNDSRIPGSMILDSYIDRHFIRYTDIGPFRIMLRNGTAPNC